MSSSRSKRVSSEYFFEPQTKKISTDESEEYKNLIYKKTIQKLKEGARLQDAAPKHLIDAVTPTKTSHLHSEVKRGLKQISLNNKCGLESETKITNPKEYCSLLPDMCSFCERLGCFTTLNQCTKCAENFCENCSFSTFVTLEENHICKSCF